MFERYLTDALGQHFGHVVENVDADKVRLSAWNGRLVLQDVFLRTNALDSFVDQCPVEIAYGKVGNFDVQIPWSYVGSQLWRRNTTKAAPQNKQDNANNVSVILSDVNILITPRRKFGSERQRSSENGSNGTADKTNDQTESNNNDTNDNDKLRLAKEKQAQDLLDEQMLKRVAISSQTTSRWQWVQDWLSNLLSHLSVTIRNIHIRYEDPGTCMGFVWIVSEHSSHLHRYRRGFSVGITLGEFSVTTTGGSIDDAVDSNIMVDADGATAVPNAQDNRVGEEDDNQEQTGAIRIRRKIAAFEELAIYWDSGNAPLMSQRAPLRETFTAVENTLSLEHKYYDSAFAVINKRDTENDFFPDEAIFRSPHTYLLDPVSPSVQFGLVDSAEEVHLNSDNDGDSDPTLQQSPSRNDTANGASFIPPSTINIVLPACPFSISRSTLEDIVYVRKSLSVWGQTRKGLISDETLKRLAKLRPLTSAVDNPRGWWEYAVEATIAFIQLSRDSNQRRQQMGHQQPHHEIKRRRTGWLGLAQTLGRKRRYVELYRELLTATRGNAWLDTASKSSATLDCASAPENGGKAHNAILALEDELNAAEICAFRIATYYALVDDADVKLKSWALPQNADTNQHTPKRRWRGFWLDSKVNDWSNAPPKPTIDIEQSRLSLDHRCQMFAEMVEALEREKVNTELLKQEQGQNTPLPLPGSFVPADKQSLELWRLSMSCRELSLQVNDQQRSKYGPRRSNRRLSSSSLRSSVPVARLSCASLLQSHLYFDGSWQMDCSIASLEMKDLTGGSKNTAEGKVEYSNYPSLIGPKKPYSGQDVDLIYLDGDPFRQSIHISVCRTMHWYTSTTFAHSPKSELGSTTRTSIRLFSMEVIYSTAPVEALSRVFAAVKTPELADDYHRMASRAYAWREMQQKRLLQALANKMKKIVVDVDVTAPVLLIPETLSSSDSPMLVIDLGRLQFYNVELDGSNRRAMLDHTATDFDDHWRLVLSNIQVQCTSTILYRELPTVQAFDRANNPLHRQKQQLVEPFSLDFSVLSKVAAEGNETLVRIEATLPRLGFNLTSSAVRLVSRLQSQWLKRRDEMKMLVYAYASAPDMQTSRAREYSFDNLVKSSNELPRVDLQKKANPPSSQRRRSAQSSERIFEFRFSAPLIMFRLENDVDGRDCVISNATPRTDKSDVTRTAQIMDLALRGIGGSIIKKTTSSGNSFLKLDARLRSLDAVDLYQTAGPDYALLLSSLSPEIVLSRADAREELSWQVLLGQDHADAQSSSTDLVGVTYMSSEEYGISPSYGSPSSQRADLVHDKLSIDFYELYVEWNPETIAAIHKAMRTPAQKAPVESLVSPNVTATEEDAEISDMFFDAQEDYFFDAGCESESDADLETSGLSVAGPGASFESFNDQDGSMAESPRPRPGFLMEDEAPQFDASKLNLNKSIMESRFIGQDVHEEENEQLTPDKPFEVEFNLSKLRVNFNKESRHRRLLTAEMDRTRIAYVSQVDGGSRTDASLGNLIFSDPATSQSQTLYSQILGLQSESRSSTGEDKSSLLEMEILINPRIRRIVEPICELRPGNLEGVSVDYDKGSISGFDTMMKARFSPMRFVYLQQLWSEIADYFFEGIVGYEVWGKARPQATLDSDLSEKIELKCTKESACSAFEAISFTGFDIIVDSPILLFPVTYRSPQFLRITASNIVVSNFYNCDTTRGSACGNDPTTWHNNCILFIQGLRIFNPLGKEISQSRNAVGVKITLRWPTGPMAHTETPKWNVRCAFDSLDMSLQKEDYALIQNIISFNMGEDTRNLDEWNALQNLSPRELLHYKEKIMVHFGYDKKDVAPTTYQIQLTIPSVSVSLDSSDGVASEECRTVAIARCTNLAWGMIKLTDRITRQKITCDVDLIHPKSGGGSEMLLSSVKHESDERGPSVPELTYTSTSRPSGDNVKTLEIVNSCIFWLYPAWVSLSGFFQNLPEMLIFTAQEVGLSVQVGDRWYRIGGSSAGGDVAANTGDETPQRQFRWIGKADETNLPQDQSDEDVGQSPSFQLRIKLTSPCIILSSCADDSSVVLRLSHLDFLHINDGRQHTISRTFFLHDLEVYTSREKDASLNTNDGGNSLIHPWSVAGTTARCNEKKTCSCESHAWQIRADILKARAAFSDMTVVIDVFLRLRFDMRQQKKKSRANQVELKISSSEDLTVESASMVSSSADESENVETVRPKLTLASMDWDGAELLIVDDSGRHFAGSQELITLSLGRTIFSRSQALSPVVGHVAEDPKTANAERLVSDISLRVMSIDLIDCLQSERSPFRLLATSRSEGVSPLSSRQRRRSGLADPRLEWPDGETEVTKEWGFRASRSLLSRLPPKVRRGGFAASDENDLIEFDSCEEEGVSKKHAIKLRSFSLQWNPSTVIALQRFLGRLLKEAKIKSRQVFNENLENLMNEPREPEQHSQEVHSLAQEEEVTKAVLDIDCLTVCLNKEHQDRRLLKMVLSGSHITLERGADGMGIQGRVGDINAWDCNFSAGTFEQETNGAVLRVAHLAENAARRSGMERRTTVAPSFLHFSYKTFNKQLCETDRVCLPDWVLSHLSNADWGTREIDDYLGVSVATVKFTYLRERTEEILDYLSNGLPGKGMGATSKAAHGFLKKRIRTKSFLQVQIESPTVFVPRHESATSGIALRLGDMTIHSWFESGTCAGRIDKMELCKTASTLAAVSFPPSTDKEETEWWRMLSLSLEGLSACTFNRNQNVCFNTTSLVRPLDVSILLQKPAWHVKTLSLRGKLSLVDITLKYSEYCQLQAVLHDNLGRKIDKDKWDNVEKAYEMEEEDDDMELPPVAVEKNHAKRVEYASNARYIRYGRKAKKKETVEASPDEEAGKGGVKKKTELDLKFRFDGLSWKLHRDDEVEPSAAIDGETISAFNYDMVLLRVQIVEVSISNNASGDISFHMSLFRIGLFDLGDSDRLLRDAFERERENRKMKKQRLPSAFCVLVEGYSPLEKQQRAEMEDKSIEDVDAQLVISIDRCSSSSVGNIGTLDNHVDESDKVTVARVVLNYLSVNVQTRPFREVLAFLSNSWASPYMKSHKITDVSRDDSQELRASSNALPPASTTSSGLQVKLVAHYPRIFFVADESDPHSRALVLRGLAVVNAGISTKTIVEEEDLAVLGATSCRAEREDVHSSLMVDAQLHAMESYINPDVHGALRLQQRHVDMIGSAANVHAFYPFSMQEGDFNDFGDDVLGVALLQPVTTGIEFGRTCRSRFPSKRSLCINMEPISTMLSFEDLQLIESVLVRLSSERNYEVEYGDRLTDNSATMPGGPDYGTIQTDETFEVVFYTERLGLGLRKESGSIVVDEVQDSRYGDVEVGDALVSINDHKLWGVSLPSVVQQLSQTPRPIRVTFRRRTVAVPEHSVGRNSVAIVERTEANDVAQKLGNSSFFLVHFRQGAPFGIILDKSIVEVPVVSKIETSLKDSVVGISYADVAAAPIRLPRTGALIVRINGLPTVELGFEATISKLQELSDSMTQNQSGLSYSVEFLEIDAVLWGYHDSFDVSASGAVLTFIDDLGGRDMPLVRGTARAVELHFEQGMCMQTSILDSTTPGFLQMADQSSLNGAFASDSTMKLTAIFRSTIEYYHPQIAVWEPFLEPAQLCVLIERQTKMQTGRAEELAVEISDRLLRKHCLGHAATSELKPQLLCVNVSDAACEVASKALREWKSWRANIGIVSGGSGVFEEPAYESDPARDDENVSTEISSHSASRVDYNDSLVSSTEFVESPDTGQAMAEKARLLRTRSHAAARKAAQAALRFAKKRGASKNSKSESSMPFVLRNRTGISIAFVQQRGADELRAVQEVHQSAVGEYRGLENYNQADVTELADGEDARFQMDLVAMVSTPLERRDSAGHFSTKRIRNYEGQFPRLAVAIQAVAGVLVDPIKDLQVFKAGSSVRQLSVLKLMSNAAEAPPSPYFIPVIFSVKICDNRRVLTLSSAVRIESLGSRVFVDVGIQKCPVFEQHPRSGQSCASSESTASLHNVSEVNTKRASSQRRGLCRECFGDGPESQGEAVIGSPIGSPISTNMKGSPGSDAGGSSICPFLDPFSSPDASPMVMCDPASITLPYPFNSFRDSQSVSSTAEPISPTLRSNNDAGARNQLSADSYDIFEEPNLGGDEVVDFENSKSFQTIGVALPESPFYLPLWLALQLEVVRVYVRPRIDGMPPYFWGRQSVLEFAPESIGGLKLQETQAGKWAWKETFKTCFESILCNATNKEFPPVWLSCYASTLNSAERGSAVEFRATQSLTAEQQQVNGELKEVLSISIDSSLSLRNMLPFDIEWEVGQALGQGRALGPGVELVDGSTKRRGRSQASLPQQDVDGTNMDDALKSGECAEVYACNTKARCLSSRFRPQTHKASWTSWASVSIPQHIGTFKSDVINPMDDAGDDRMPTVRQINVQIMDDFGAPLTMGVRVVPKVVKVSQNGLAFCYGMDVIVYAELWIKNLTQLPLTFGCPTRQIYASQGRRDSIKNTAPDEVAARFSAEAALMEIASVLGESQNSTRMDTRSALLAEASGDLHILPDQESSYIVEEIFEYVEVNGSEIKRRWWASESFRNLRNNILDVDDEGKNWRWISDWTIEGWESCASLLGGGDGPFSGKRDFDPAHAYRRRRWFRARATRGLAAAPAEDSTSDKKMFGGLQAIHQPIEDSFSKSQERARKKQMKKAKGKKRFDDNPDTPGSDADCLELAIKCGGGRWSTPLKLPVGGSCNGVISIFASRWDAVTAAEGSGPNNPLKGSTPLSPRVFEISYSASEVDGEWGEFSRMLLVAARFSVRNDSSIITMEVKQAGAKDESAIKLPPGEISPFHWSDSRLPQLACVRPVCVQADLRNSYAWSGGFDICRLGMTSLGVRQKRLQRSLDLKTGLSSAPVPSIRSIRSLVEIRPGTGGSGINLSFKEEDPEGNGALVRIENNTPFLLFLAQDGVLANPNLSPTNDDNSRQGQGLNDSDGDILFPGDRISFGLDVPFRQGKYKGRKAATMSDLLRIRVGLAPLSSRDGIESTKVIGLTVVGESIRLKPSKLMTMVSAAQRKSLERVRVLGITTADGPSRVLKFSLMATEADNVFTSSFMMESVSYGAQRDVNQFSTLAHYNTSNFAQAIAKAALQAQHLVESKRLPSEGEAKRIALFGGTLFGKPSLDDSEPASVPGSSRHYSIHVALSGFLCSFVDSSPSEIATATVNNFNALARWNSSRTEDASFLLSVGWLQVDNHVPSAPFPVAICPDDTFRDGQLEKNSSPEVGDRPTASPLLVVGIEFAPQHSSGIVCLKSVTIAPRNMSVSFDISFLVRLQRYISGVQGHFQASSSGDLRGSVLLPEVGQKRYIPLPDLDQKVNAVLDAMATGVGQQKLYFGALTILPFAIKLSVAPARALTPAQAAIEGIEAAAIHQAVRKGDLRFIGQSSTPLSVTVGSKNTTALAVVRGVFKSIFVDALLRLNGASLNFSGAFLRNQIFGGRQLATYLGAHYTQSLRQNVPALLGSLSAFGNPLGLIRGLGDGMSDFVIEPVKGFKRSVQRLDPSHLVDGVARGTGSLARHTVGGFADSAAMLTETFSKNMTVLTLDRRYAQKRDRGNELRGQNGDLQMTFVDGVESGMVKLAQGFLEGVTGVVKAPMRGAERSGFEGFAKGIGKGLLGLLVKPIIGISDAATDVMIGVKSSVEHDSTQGNPRQQIRPRRAFYGRDKVMRTYNLADAAACALMLRTRIGGQQYLSHLDMDDRVALLSVRRLLLLGAEGREILLVRLKHIADVELHEFEGEEWEILIRLNIPRRNGSESEVIRCKSHAHALELFRQIKLGMNQVESEV